MARRSSPSAERHVRPARGPHPARDRAINEPESAIAKRASRGPRSEIGRLAAELERLRIELDAARSAIAALEAQANVDALTGILNRRGLLHELDRAIAYVARYRARAALVYLDLDAFKPINDRHGHAAGDAALQAVGATLRRNVRASDVTARIGGDEFAVILWNLAEPAALAKADALARAIAAIRIARADAVLSVGVATGVTMLGPDDRADGVLERADRAMYARKRRRQVPSYRTTR